VKRSSYGKRDYAFGQMMLKLRTSIGLTQAGLGDRLGVSRRAVAEWEAGNNYPKADHLKQLIALGVRQHAFAVGREAEEILKVSSDGRRLASCGDDNVIHVWDLESGERLRTLQRDRPYERLDISGVKGLTKGQRASLRALGAIEGAT
jgi:transcriptional regulator with XRE-family HTH domain